MFIRRSTYNRIVGRADAYAQDARNEVTRQVALAEVRQADHDRIVAGLAADLAAETRRADRLQKAYDNAVGLDAPALDLGAQWQDRRTDKAQAVKG